MINSTPYRPRNAGHDNYDRGLYLITLVTRECLPLFGKLNMDVRNPATDLTALGQTVKDLWQLMPEAQASHGNKIKLLAQVVMPDHWHGVIEVEERMNWSLGKIIQTFKVACSNQWQKQDDATQEQLPVFEDKYDDVIRMNKGEREAMLNYVTDNPRRAIYRKLYPQFQEQRMHVNIAGRDYAAFGNLFLLKWANKEQVFCHRRDNDGKPYELTTLFQQERNEWMRSARDGFTVLVTPGISKGELQIKNDCLEQGLPLIHLQKEPIDKSWKPDRKRLNACINGRLLILSPWALDKMDSVQSPIHGIVPANTDFSRFHNMNELAREICTFHGEAKIIK